LRRDQPDAYDRAHPRPSRRDDEDELMAAGLAALLDDIAALAKVAAASIDDVSAAAGRASMKAAGVVVDDTAVTPRYVSGFTADRELPMIRRIAVGSLRNKLLFILPAALLLSQFLPWLLTPILMVGGTYLAFEGAEKLYELVTGHGKESAQSPHVPKEHDEAPLPSTAQGEDTEKSMVAGAIRTDFILSAEIMVIALNEVSDQPFVSRAISLVLVALGITVLVYGVVALIVKMDDIGLRLAATKQGAVAATGRMLVKAMPKVLAILSTVGIIAMLWVGGHILLVGADELGWHAPYELVHHAEEAVHDAVAGLGGFLAWLTNTIASAVIGLVVGAVVVAVMHVLPRRKGAGAAH
jgi:predicted DNA repair protein MutK